MAEALTFQPQGNLQQAETELVSAIDLFRCLNDGGVRYCLWKSNIRLLQGLRGETDLDLLVDRRHSHLFQKILLDLDVKRVDAAPGRRFPAMEHYLGLDAATGRLFHLHVHYQLVLGEQFIKNYRIPLEDLFLDSTYFERGVRLVVPDLEIIVLSLRILLKYRDRDVVKDILGIRSPSVPKGFLREIEWLLARTTRARIAERLSTLSGIIPADIVTALLDIVTAHRKPGAQLFRLRSRLRFALNHFRRSNPWAAGFEYLRRALDLRGLLRSAGPTRMTMPVGGFTLAIIGADGSGKSSVTDSLARWLRWKLDARAYYLGGKSLSLSARLYYLIHRAFRKAGRTVKRVPGGDLADRICGWLGELSLCMHHVSVAKARYRHYREGLIMALAGSVVIFDRFPISVLNTQGLDIQEMDGPKIPELLHGRNNALAQALSRREQRFYRDFRLPDYLVVLDVGPEIAAMRKPDHSPAQLAAKSRSIRDLMGARDAGMPTSRVVHINAELPFEEVMARVKREVWGLL